MCFDTHLNVFSISSIRRLVIYIDNRPSSPNCKHKFDSSTKILKVNSFHLRRVDDVTIVKWCLKVFFFIMFFQSEQLQFTLLKNAF